MDGTVFPVPTLELECESQPAVQGGPCWPYNTTTGCRVHPAAQTRCSDYCCSDTQLIKPEPPGKLETDKIISIHNDVVGNPTFNAKNSKI